MFEKKSLKYKLFSYAGSKDKHLDLISNFVKNTKYEIYCEPFLGSGVIFFNLRKKFKKYILAEKDTNLFNLFNHLFFSTINEGDFTKFFHYIDSKYNVSTYEGFYSFRDYFNKNLWNSNSVEEAFSLIILANNCINSLYRFGEIGFNSSFGNRNLSRFKCLRVELTIKKIKSFKNIFLFNDFDECMQFNNCFYILDPPYHSKYVGYSWSVEDLKNLLSKLNFKNNNYLYFDIENELGNFYFNNKIQLLPLRSIAPKNRDKFSNEVLYYSIT